MLLCYVHHGILLLCRELVGLSFLPVVIFGYLLTLLNVLLYIRTYITK